MTHFQDLESLAFGTDPKSCLQLWQTNTHGQRERFALGVNLNEKGGCVASLTLRGLPVPQDLLPGDKIARLWASLVVQWLRIRLPMQGTRVRALVREDPTCRGAARPVRPNY